MATVLKPRRKNREATERALIDACGRLLLRDGADGIGVNNVVAEAGVGKDLIYRYFGGLPGLLKAWLQQDDNWPTTAELTGDQQAFDRLSLQDKLRTIWRNYARALRERPVLMRIMASELMHPTEVTAVLDQAGDRIGRSLAAIISDMDASDQMDVLDINFICCSMINYVCMRAATSPDIFGHNFRDEESWAYTNRVIDKLASRYLDQA